MEIVLAVVVGGAIWALGMGVFKPEPEPTLTAEQDAELNARLDAVEPRRLAYLAALADAEKAKAATSSAGTPAPETD